MKKEDPTIATLLKAQGYMTGQFGKNHLGDRDDMLPTNHGFDEFFGNLYHLNAEEEPENADYPEEPGVQEEVRSARRDPQLRRRPHHRYRPAHEEAHGDHRRGGHRKALDFMERAKKADKPFFLWWNSTRMHIFTHLKPESEGKTGLGIYADGMVEHDGHVGQVLAKLKELGLDENTIVMYSTDNGAETFTWPDGGTTMFRGEKNTQWEGGYRVPHADPLARRHQARHGDQRHRRARGHAADAARRRRRQDRQGGSAQGPQDRRQATYKVHLDGYDLGPPEGRGRLAAQGVHLLDRRRQRRRAALRQLEGHLPEAGRPMA
jgi:arylsulfatase A-like enzyme